MRVGNLPNVHLCPQCPVLNEAEPTAGKTQGRYVSEDPPFPHSLRLGLYETRLGLYLTGPIFSTAHVAKQPQ